MRLTLALLCAFAGLAAGATYTNRYDHLHVKDFIRNKAFVKHFVQCLLDLVKSCTPEATEVKTHLVESLSNDCASCTDHQRIESEVAISYFINEEPGNWKLLSEKYDPSGLYRQKHESRLKTLYGKKLYA